VVYCICYYPTAVKLGHSAFTQASTGIVMTQSSSTATQKHLPEHFPCVTSAGPRHIMFTSCTICYTTGISTPTHLLPHVTLCRFCSGRLRPGSTLAQVLLTLLTLLTAPWRSQDPSYYKLPTFNEGPETRLGSRKWDHSIFTTYALPKLPPGLCLCLSVNL
jgi:hypothetical protein